MESHLPSRGGWDATLTTVTQDRKKPGFCKNPGFWPDTASIDGPFGRLNDICVALGGILSGGLMAVGLLAAPGILARLDPIDPTSAPWFV